VDSCNLWRKLNNGNTTKEELDFKINWSRPIAVAQSPLTPTEPSPISFIIWIYGLSVLNKKIKVGVKFILLFSPC
jgi:hypothetical protein